MIHHTIFHAALEAAAFARRSMAVCAVTTLSIFVPAVAWPAPFAYITSAPVGDGSIMIVNGALTVVDIATNKIVGAPIPVGPLPQGVAVSPRGDRAYVVNRHNSGHGSISVIATDTNTLIATIPIAGFPGGIAISPDGRRGYVASTWGGTVTMVDLVALRVMSSIPIGGMPYDIAIDPTGRVLYATNEAAIVVLDAHDLGWLATFNYGSRPKGVVVSADGHRIYVSNTLSGAYPGNTVTVLDAFSGSILGVVVVGRHPVGLAIGSDGRRLYVMNEVDASVTVVDLATNSVITTVAVGTPLDVGYTPMGIAVTPDGRSVYVTNSRESKVVVIDTSTHQTSEPLPRISVALAMGKFIGPVKPRTQVIEYYNASLDHYFATQSALEVRDLDAGVHKGWVRSGLTFDAYHAMSPVRGNAVCRYYGRPDAGLDTHFYSADIAECAAIATSAYREDWILEDARAFEIGMPDRINGTCPEDGLPVYRLWNGRSDSNHRYVTDPEIQRAMVAGGYRAEGYGPTAVAMCALK